MLPLIRFKLQCLAVLGSKFNFLYAYLIPNVEKYVVICNAESLICLDKDSISLSMFIY